jgi:lactate dehydrogenase-like 2-hydroxyacid dehydrogenase
MNRPRVFVTRKIPQTGLEHLDSVCDADVWEDVLPPPYPLLSQRAQGVEGILCTLNDQIDAALMDHCGPQLKVISQMAVGYDNIDIKAANMRGIQVGNTPGVLTDATADLTMALLLSSARRLQEGVQYIREGHWQTWDPNALIGADLVGATLGIIGLGRIGKAVARRAQGFGMHILATGRQLTHEDAQTVQARAVDLETLLRQSDFVSVHVPLNPQTRNLIGEPQLRLMKPTAYLINTARGPIVNSQALYQAVRDGWIAGAALDVTDPEPITLSDPLLSLPNVLIVPHIGSASRQTRDRMALMAAENLVAGLSGTLLPHAVVVT